MLNDGYHKPDKGKARYDLIAPEMLEAVAKVMTASVDTHGARNWEKGTNWGRIFAAAMRHLWKWWGGENLDPDSGFSHLAHAASCIMFLISYEARGTGEDDRSAAPPVPSPSAATTTPAERLHMRGRVKS